MSFAFSPVGAAYLVMLFVPNLLALLALERIGQAGTTITALVAPASESPGAARLACLGASLLAMVLYELSWLRYFRTDLAAPSLYRSLGPVPLPLAVLPVLGFLLLALYEAHAVLLGAVVVLGVGHVGIHRQHARRLP